MKAINRSPVSPMELADLLHSPIPPSLEESSKNDVEKGREIIQLVLEGNKKEPQLLPLEYVRYICDNYTSQETDVNHERCFGTDVLLDNKFDVVSTTNSEKVLESYSSHPNLQRLYGYCPLQNNTSILVLENFPKGAVDCFLMNSKGRLQLNAQRRIQIMLDSAIVLKNSAEQALNLSSSRVGLMLDLSSKVFVGIETNEKSLSDNIPVFSFGVLMIELLTGALQNNGSDDRKFGDFSARYAKGSKKIIEDDLDPYVRESWTFNILSQLIELALGCIESNAEKRPSTAKLVDTLTLISSRMQVVASYDYYV